MAYETKVLLKQLFKYLDRCDTVDEVKDYVKDIANAEGVVIDEPIVKRKAKASAKTK